MLQQALSQFPSLSPLSVECCLNSGIVTLGDLFEFIRSEELSSIDGSGPVAIKELSELVSKYEKQISGYQYDLFSIPDSEVCEEERYLPAPDLYVRRLTSQKILDVLTEVYEDVLSSLPSERASVYRNAFPTASSLLFTLSREHKVITTVNPSWSVHFNVHFWDFCHQALSAMLEVVGDDLGNSLTSLIRKTLEYLDSVLRYKKFALILPSLSPIQTTVVQEEYDRIYRQLSSRARGAIANMGLQMHDVLEMTFNSDPASFHYKNAGVTTFTEIKERFAPLVDMVIDVIDRSSHALIVTHLSHRFPNFPEQRLRHVAQIQEKIGHLPLFYLIYWMLAASDQRPDKIYAAAYGIGTEATTRSALAKKMQLSLERIRQILNAYKPTGLMKDLIEENRHNYAHIQDELLDPAEACREAIEQEADGDTLFSPSCLAGILKLIFSSHVLWFDTRCYLVSEKVAACFDFKAALKQIEEASEKKRATDEFLPLRHLIDPYLKSSNPELRAKVLDILLRIIAGTQKWVIEDVPCAVLPQNTLVVEEEVYKILYERGEPMKLVDIQAVLSQRFPFRDFSKKESLRSYLIKSDRICAVGKTSTYALDQWQGSTLTVRDHIYEIINQSQRPLTINEIRDALSKLGIDRSWTNIYSTIFTDSRRKYARYNKSYFGLSTATYDASFVEEPMKKRE